MSLKEQSKLSTTAAKAAVKQAAAVDRQRAKFRKMAQTKRTKRLAAWDAAMRTVSAPFYVGWRRAHGALFGQLAWSELKKQLTVEHLDKAPIAKLTATTEAEIRLEEQHKAEAEAEDQPTAGTPAHAEKLRCCGIRIDYLLGLTFALNMWDWKTWEVVQYLVKPMTEGEGRCRFADLSGVRPYTGAATVFMSRCQRPKAKLQIEKAKFSMGK